MSRKGTIGESSGSDGIDLENLNLEKAQQIVKKITKNMTFGARAFITGAVCTIVPFILYSELKDEENLRQEQNLYYLQENISDRVQEDLISKYVGDDSVFDAHDIARIGNDLGLEDVVYMHDSRVNVLTEDDSRNSYFLGNSLQISLDDARRLAYNTDYKSEL